MTWRHAAECGDSKLKHNNDNMSDRKKKSNDGCEHRQSIEVAERALIQKVTRLGEGCYTSGAELLNR